MNYYNDILEKINNSFSKYIDLDVNQESQVL